MKKLKDNILPLLLVFTFVIPVIPFGGYQAYKYLSNPGAAKKEGIESSTQVQTSHVENYVDVKYRDDNVDIGHPRFEPLPSKESSLVKGAWYDEGNAYMIINLNGINYHYCAFPLSGWEGLKESYSYGSYYSNEIKGNYDCRENPVPVY